MTRAAFPNHQPGPEIPPIHIRSRSGSPRQRPSTLDSKVAKWKAPVAVILATAIALLNPTPATADDRTKTVRLEAPKGSIPVAHLVTDGSGNPTNDFSVRTHTTSAKQYSVFTVGANTTVVCTLWASPSPTYSASNHRMHWGGQAQCNTPITTKIRMSLWSGPDENDITRYQHSTTWTYKVGTNHSQNENAACLDWGYFAYWRLFVYAEADTNYDGLFEQFVPYPGQTTRYQECVDIA